jgi:hypothetical protein
MLDGSVYPKNLMQMFEYLEVLGYLMSWPAGIHREHGMKGLGGRMSSMVGVRTTTQMEASLKVSSKMASEVAWG